MSAEGRQLGFAEMIELALDVAVKMGLIAVEYRY